MQHITTKAVKWLAMLVIIVLALVCYSMGAMSGFVSLVVLGFILEGTFWLFCAKLFSRKKGLQDNN
ncbi:MAG: hypothetical protein ACTJH9_12635 [Pseudoalteromonas sp.]|uniref:hypothetical protein n=1 Tax=unclassified Pseudoalteromonas TaxID=194690 RepID=UPI003F955C34